MHMAKSTSNKQSRAKRGAPVGKNVRKKTRPSRAKQKGAAGRKKKVAPVGKQRRFSKISRTTSETNILLELDIDGIGTHSIKTGIPFLDHMLVLFTRHGMFNLSLKAVGDLDVDIHHTNEDVALTLGQAFAKGLIDKKGIRRYGFFLLPMDEALVRVVLDISNRPGFFISGLPKRPRGKRVYSFLDCEHFMKSFSQAAGLTLHITVLSGRDRHHILEAIFKALARALDMAVSKDPRTDSVPSTKGIL